MKICTEIRMSPEINVMKSLKQALIMLMFLSALISSTPDLI